MKRFDYILIFIILLMFGSFLLFIPIPVGTADNSDFVRVTQAAGMIRDDSIRFFYFQPQYKYIEESNNFFQHLLFVIHPNVKDMVGFKSTQIFLVKVAQIVNGVIYYIKDGFIDRFDIRYQGLLLLIIHSAALILLFKSFGIKNKWGNLGIILIIVLIYFDVGYLIYYNSFFGEGITLASFLLWFASTLYLIRSKEIGYTMLIVYIVSAIVFIGAKVANVPLGAGIVLFTSIFIFKEKNIRKRVLVITGIVCMAAASVYYYLSVPGWMLNMNKYHSLFYGILKDSPNPQKDLADLGIDKKYEELAGTHYYGYNEQYDISSEEFGREVYQHSGFSKISKYYITHPGRLLQKLNISAESSLPIRPTYLGNYPPEAGNEIVRFTQRFSFWENFRKSFSGKALPVITSVFMFFICIAFYGFFKYRKGRTLVESYLETGVRLMLAVFALAEFILPVIGNGEADLAKHMFLFNILFDMMLIVMIIDIIKLAQNKLLNKTIIMTLMIVAVFIGGNYLVQAESRHRTLTFGKYGGNPVTWEIIEETDEYYFLVSEDIITQYVFSRDNKNLWIESDIRKWLNDESPEGFLGQFNNKEKSLIKPVAIKTVLSPAFREQAETGSRPHYWDSIPGNVTQNYDEAYGVIEEEKVFLLSVKQWEEYKFNKKKGAIYWLRTPYTDQRVVRVVGKDGYVYHKLANMEEVGVVPAMYIKKANNIN